MGQLQITSRRRRWHAASLQYAAASISLAFVLGASLGAAANAAKPDFDRQIRPILSDKCYMCHGPDAESRKAELRLDTKAASIRSSCRASRTTAN